MDAILETPEEDLNEWLVEPETKNDLTTLMASFLGIQCVRNMGTDKVEVLADMAARQNVKAQVQPLSPIHWSS